MPAVELEIYLNYLLPWGPDHAQLYKCVTTFWTAKDGKTGTINEAVRSYDELLDLIESRVGWKGSEVFLAMGTQKMAGTNPSRDGRAVYALRKANNMSTFNALWVDVDVGPDKPYKTTEEAERAAEEFRKAAGLPPVSLRNYTGSGGFHDFWCFAEPVAKDVWELCANALKAACDHHKFDIDAKCTGDAARILRLPTTLNRKHNPPRESRLDIGIAKQARLYEPGDLSAALKPFMTARAKTGTGPSATVHGIGANFTAGTTDKIPPVSIDAVAKNCPMTAQTLETGGAGKREPEWQMDIYLSAFTSDPQDAAHRLSQGHAEYDPAETDKKLEQKQIAIRSGNLGWPECSKFHHAACQTCPLRSLGKSPFHFAQPDVPNVHPTEDDDEIMPDGYFRNRYNHVVGQLANGSHFRVVPYPLLDAFIDGDTNEPVIKYMTTTGKEQFGTISLAKQGPTAFAEAWTKATCNMMLLSPKPLGAFMMSFVGRLRELGTKRTIRSTGMGWDGDDFVFDEIYMPNGSKAAYRSREIVDLNYKREGKLEPWQDAMEKVIYGNAPLEILVASSFAAPLVSLMAPYSLILSVYSPASGFGKTTGISLAQAVWAQPEKMSQIQDTTNSVMGKLAALRHLPLYWDELKLQDEMEEIVKIIFRVISGRDKTRMKQDATLRHQAQAARTMMAICSNQSVAAMAVEATEGTDAGGVRVFEVEADPLKRTPGVHVESMMLSLDSNYGVAGSIYAKSLVKNKAKVISIIQAVREQYESQIEFHERERFWKATMVSITAGAMVANACGITRFDVEAIQKRLISTFETMRTNQTSNQTHSTTTTFGATGIFEEMFNELIGNKHCVVSAALNYGRGYPVASAGNNMTQIGTKEDYREIVAQKGVEDGRRLIKRRTFQKWMRDHNRGPEQVLQLLNGEYRIIKKRATLCAGIKGFELGQVDCYEFIPLNHNPSDPSASSG
jgi:Domain of unknown function (DUF927)